MAGIHNETLYGANMDFREVWPPAPQIVLDGQFFIGAAVAPFLRAGLLTCLDGTLTVNLGPGTIDLSASSTGILKTLTGDTGTATPVSSNIKIAGLSGAKTLASGANVTVRSPPFSQIGSSATSDLNTGEFVTAAVTRTLPVSAGLADGDLFIYSCTTAGALVIQAVGAQKIRMGTLLSSAAGTATSTAIGDSVTLRFDATQGFFMAVAWVGVWLIA